MKTVILLTLLTISTISYSQKFIEMDESGHPHPLAKKPAPIFKAKTLDNKEINLEDLKGKIILIDFWSLSCNACFKEIPEFNDIVKKYPKDKFVLISLMDNTTEDILEKFEIANEGYKMKRPVHGNDKIDFQIIPNGRQIMKLYTDDLVFPRAFIIDQNGIVTFHFEGYGPKDFEGALSSSDMFVDEIERLLSASR